MRHVSSENSLSLTSSILTVRFRLRVSEHKTQLSSFTRKKMKYSEGIEELQKSTRRITKQFEHEARMLFGNRREHLVMSPEIVVDAASFLIGGLGAVGVGYVTDEIEEGVAGSSTSLFGSYTLRGLTIPTKIGVRFLSGGCIYVLVDTLIIKMHRTRIPLACGALTGLCFVNRDWSGIALSSILGMAVFSHVVDGAYEKLINYLF